MTIDAGFLDAYGELVRGGPVAIDCVSLHPDRDAGIIWGVDPYGCDVVAAVSLDEEGVRTALRWCVDSLCAPVGTHCAEFAY